MHYHGFGGMGLGMGLGWIIGILVVAAVIWLIIKTVNTGNQASPGRDKSALDILKERYARGEIEKSEFEEKKKDLT